MGKAVTKILQENIVGVPTAVLVIWIKCERVSGDMFVPIVKVLERVCGIGIRRLKEI